MRMTVAGDPGLSLGNPQPAPERKKKHLVDTLVAAGSPEPGLGTGVPSDDGHRPWQAWGEVWPNTPTLAVQPALSILKSCEIALRGFPVWVAAVQATWSMTLEDSRAAQRSRRSCRSLARLLLLERDLARQTQASTIVRQLLLMRIALQLCGEAAEPPQRFVGATFDLAQLAVRPERP